MYGFLPHYNSDVSLSSGRRCEFSMIDLCDANSTSICSTVKFSNDCTVGICSNCTYVHIDTCELATYKLTSMHSNYTVNKLVAKILKVS